MTARPGGEETKRTIGEMRRRLAAGEAPLTVLHGAFAGRTALLLSAGPSLARWREVLERESESRPVVVAIKQALLEAGELCDLHFVNPYNHRKYDAVPGERLVVHTGVRGAPPVFGRRDVVFEIDKAADAGLADTLAVRRDFADWELAVSGARRPWGPGIVHETVLYTLLHMGFGRVVTAGWDIADDRGFNRHFYDRAEGEPAVGEGEQAEPAPAPVRTPPSRLRRLLAGSHAARYAVRLLRHHAGRTYNPPALLAGEASAVSASIGDFLTWFERRGMEVRVVSDSRWMRHGCPRFVVDLRSGAIRPDAGRRSVIFCMPSPSIVTATAEWVVTGNWVHAAELRLGEAVVDVAGRAVENAAVAGHSPMRKPAPPRLVARGEPRLIWLRTLVADLRRMVRNLAARRRPLVSPLPPRPCFVWEYHYPFFRRARRYAAALGCPTVRFVPALQVWEAARWGVDRGIWGRWLERFGELPGLRESDLVCCVSEQVREAVIERAGLDPAKVIVTPNTARSAAAAVSAEEVARMRRAWGIDDGTVVAGWTGSFRSFHDLDFLVESLAAVEAPPGRWTLVLVGDGRDRGRIEAQVARRGLPVRCVGAVPFEAMPVALAAMDLAVLPLRSARRFHYSPVKLREYAAAGLPIVAPDVDDSRRLLGDEPELLYRPGDGTVLAAQVSALVADAEMRFRLSKLVRARHAESGETGREIDQVLTALGLDGRAG